MNKEQKNKPQSTQSIRREISLCAPSALLAVKNHQQRTNMKGTLSNLSRTFLVQFTDAARVLRGTAEHIGTKKPEAMELNEEQSSPLSTAEG